MRDPNRIDGYMELMTEVWKKVPDWRFGQLMKNIIDAYEMDTHMDAFFCEDKKFFEFIKYYFKMEDK